MSISFTWRSDCRPMRRSYRPSPRAPPPRSRPSYRGTPTDSRAPHRAASVLCPSIFPATPRRGGCRSAPGCGLTRSSPPVGRTRLDQATDSKAKVKAREVSSVNTGSNIILVGHNFKLADYHPDHFSTHSRFCVSTVFPVYNTLTPATARGDNLWGTNIFLTPTF